MSRKLTHADTLIHQFDTVLRTLVPHAASSSRPSPITPDIDDDPMTLDERRHAAGLMRVNHTGEVCAQALYQGQGCTAKLPEVREQMADAVRLLKELGCTVVELDTAPLQDFNAVMRLIIVAEAYALHEHDLTTRPELYSRAFRVRVMGGALLRAADYLQAQRQRKTLAAQFNALFQRVDVLVTATAPSPPPKLVDQDPREGLARTMFTAPAGTSEVSRT